MDFVISLLPSSLPVQFLLASFVLAALIAAYTNRYKFEPSELETLFKEVALLRMPIRAKIEVLEERLMDAYPSYMRPNAPWFLNYAGGILCGLKVIYCSNWEYILVWGTPAGNEGITGRHPFCDFYDTTLEGDVLYWSEKDPLETEIFSPGDQWVHRAGDSGGQRIDGAGWAVEYCRGPLITILPFGFVMALTNSLDIFTLLYTLYVYAFTILYCNILPTPLQRWFSGTQPSSSKTFEESFEAEEAAIIPPSPNLNLRSRRVSRSVVGTPVRRKRRGSIAS